MFKSIFHKDLTLFNFLVRSHPSSFLETNRVLCDDYFACTANYFKRRLGRQNNTVVIHHVIGIGHVRFVFNLIADTMLLVLTI